MNLIVLLCILISTVLAVPQGSPGLEYTTQLNLLSSPASYCRGFQILSPVDYYPPTKTYKIPETINITWTVFPDRAFQNFTVIGIELQDYGEGDRVALAYGNSRELDAINWTVNDTTPTETSSMNHAQTQLNNVMSSIVVFTYPFKLRRSISWPSLPGEYDFVVSTRTEFGYCWYQTSIFRVVPWNWDSSSDTVSPSQAVNK
ncbi:hypothetical protein HK098_000438 [Nowakowskiella sp. JEL0407]|nr:hypothetical protein HK098_000438 [Nowakowskiella sp. JEL0407]